MQLAEAAGITRQTIGRWESGRFRPEHPDVVVRVAEVLGLEINEALEAAGLRPTPAPPRRPATQEPPPDPAIARLREILDDPKVSPQIKESIRNSLNALLDIARARDEAAELDRRAA